MNRPHFILGVILVMCLIAQSAWAAKTHVTDSFEVTLRTGPSTENKVIAMLSSGQPVEVLDSQGDWSHVRLLGSGVSNKEGWMLSRFLVNRLPWEAQARSLKEENIQLKEKLTRIEKKLTDAVRQEKAARSTLETIQKGVQTLTKENEGLRSSQKNRWFATGALVVLCGLLIGLVIGRQQKKRRSSVHY